MPIAQIEIPWKQTENQWRQRERTPKTNEQPPLAIDTRTEQCLQTHRTSSCRGRGTRSVTIGLPFMLGESKKTGIKRGLQAGACQSRRPGVSTAGHTHERPRAPQQARPAQRRVGKGGPPVDRYWKLKMELKKESKAMRSPRRRPYTSPFPSVCPYLVQRLLRACMTPHCLSERLLECMFCGSAGEGPMRPCCIERAVNRISSQTANACSASMFRKSTIGKASSHQAHQWAILSRKVVSRCARSNRRARDQISRPPSSRFSKYMTRSCEALAMSVTRLKDLGNPNDSLRCHKSSAIAQLPGPGAARLSAHCSRARTSICLLVVRRRELKT